MSTILRPLYPVRPLLRKNADQLGLFGGIEPVKATAKAKARQKLYGGTAAPVVPKPKTAPKPMAVPGKKPKEGDTRTNRAGNKEVLRSGRWRLADNPQVVAKEPPAAIVPVVEDLREADLVDEALPQVMLEDEPEITLDDLQEPGEESMGETGEDAPVEAGEKETESGPFMHAIAKQKPVQRGTLDGSKQLITEWKIQPYWGTFETATDAMRRVVAEMYDDPALLNASDERIRGHWRAMRNNHFLKLVKVRDKITGSPSKFFRENAPKPAMPHETDSKTIRDDDNLTVTKLGQYAYKEQSPHFWVNFLSQMSQQLRSGRNMTAAVSVAASMGEIYGDHFRVKTDTPLRRFRMHKSITADSLMAEAQARLSDAQIQQIMELGDPIEQMKAIAQIRTADTVEEQQQGVGYKALGAALYLSKKGDTKAVNEATYELSGEPMRWNRVDDAEVMPEEVLGDEGMEDEAEVMPEEEAEEDLSSVNKIPATYEETQNSNLTWEDIPALYENGHIDQIAWILDQPSLSLPFYAASRMLSILGFKDAKKKQILNKRYREEFFKKYPDSPGPSDWHGGFDIYMLRDAIESEGSLSKQKSQRAAKTQKVLKDAKEAFKANRHTGVQAYLLDLERKRKSLMDKASDMYDDAERMNRIWADARESGEIQGGQRHWVDALSARGQGPVGTRQRAHTRRLEAQKIKQEIEEIAQNPSFYENRYMHLASDVNTVDPLVQSTTLTKALYPGPYLTLLGVRYVLDSDRGVLRKASMSWEDFRSEAEAMHKEANSDEDPCWKGYEAVGMKRKKGRMVPNCVPASR